MATHAPVPSVAVEAKAASTSAPTKAHLAPTLHVKTDSLMVDFRNLHESSPSPRPVEADDHQSSEAKAREREVIKRKTVVSVALPNTEPTEIFCTQFSPDSRFLATGCGDGTVRILNAVGRSAYTLNLGANSSKLPMTCLRFRPLSINAPSQGVILTGNADGSVSHWHMASQKCMYTIAEEDNQIYAVDYRPDAEQFATAGRDCKVRLYEESTKTLLRTMQAGRSKTSAGHSNRVYALKYNPEDPHMLISGGWDNTIQLWDTRVGSSVKSIYGPHICGDAIDVRGNMLLTASWRPDNALQLWDLTTGTVIKDIPWTFNRTAADAPVDDSAVAIKKLPEMLYAAAFSPDGRYIAAGGCGTNEGKIFDTQDEFKIVDRCALGAKGVYALAFAPNGRRLAYAGGSQDVTLCDF